MGLQPLAAVRAAEPDAAASRRPPGGGRAAVGTPAARQFCPAVASDKRERAQRLREARKYALLLGGSAPDGTPPARQAGETSTSGQARAPQRASVRDRDRPPDGPRNARPGGSGGGRGPDPRASSGRPPLTAMKKIVARNGGPAGLSEKLVSQRSGSAQATARSAGGRTDGRPVGATPMAAKRGAAEPAARGAPAPSARAELASLGTARGASSAEHPANGRAGPPTKLPFSGAGGKASASAGLLRQPVARTLTEAQPSSSTASTPARLTHRAAEKPPMHRGRVELAPSKRPLGAIQSPYLKRHNGKPEVVEDEYDDDDSFVASDDDDQASGAAAYDGVSSMIRKMFGYDPNKYRGMDDRDDRDMEVGFARVQAEERRSARLAREEDAREEALLEKERQERLRRKRERKRHKGLLDDG
eukprot:SM000009S23504  [mRNA]  locus=s9:323656:325900:- [translate_table: standard]